MAMLWSWFVITCTGLLPDHPVVMRLRGWLLGRFMGHVGTDFQVASRCRIVELSNMFVGSHVFIANGCWIDAGVLVTIGDEVMLGPYVVLVTGNHTHVDGSFRFGPPTEREPVRIERGVWVGAHATILPGVTIGTGAVVGANSVVTRDVEAYSVVGGVPARTLRGRAPTRDGA